MPVLAGARRRRVTACRRLVGVTRPLAAGCTAWSGDGRLLLLGRFDQVGDAFAQWRPSQDQLAVRRVQLPPDRAGSNSFVPPPPRVPLAAGPGRPNRDR